MTRLPRIAVGTVQPGANDSPILWALLNLLERHDTTVQTFSSQARFHPRTGVSSVTGQDQRHLDSWLMTRDVAREIFFRGGMPVDLAVVEGQFRSDHERLSGGRRRAPRPESERADCHESKRADCHDSEGRLETLCDWLDLPRIAIVDARQMSGCRMPDRPDLVDGILLNAAPLGRAGAELRVNLEAIWGVPVLGSLPQQADLHRRILALPPGGAPTPSFCQTLGDALAPSFDVQRLLDIASRRNFCAATPPGLFDPRCAEQPCTIAMAYDEAFHCYFPDALDLLEYRGARIRVFSPLHGESIPADTDVVYFGCGNISQHVEELSANCCLKQALRCFAADGGRIYAECAGLAYLCEHLVLESGVGYPMAGVFPAVAHRNPLAGQPRPVELPFAHACWLGASSSRLRGYYNESWEIEPVGPLLSDACGRLISCQEAVGSRVHLDFAAQPELLDRFFHPLRSSSGAIR